MISAVFQIPGNVEDEREALMIDVTKGSIIGYQSQEPYKKALHVLDLFTFNRMKCKLLRCWKTSRSKDAVIQVEFILFSQRFYFEIS